MNDLGSQSRGTTHAAKKNHEKNHQASNIQKRLEVKNRFSML